MRAASSPGTHSGERETLVTHWLSALPQHLLVLPGDSWWPFFAALGKAGFFLLLTVAQLVLAFACGVVAIIAIMVWLWQTDQVAHATSAEVADGVFLPVGASGPRSHTWWAMMILLCVDATVFGALVFAHVHVAMAAEVCPPLGASLPGGWWPALPAALLLAGSAAIVGAQALLSRSAKSDRGKNRGEKTLVWLLVLVAMLCVFASAGFDLQAHQLAGLQPTASA